MIYFIYGEDSYRAKRKLAEIVNGYKKVHDSGLNLIYIDADEKDFRDFYSNLKINSMFAEKKLIVLKNAFSDAKFQEDFLANIKALESTKDIVIVYEDKAADQRTKFFKGLQKCAKCQEFSCLQPAMLKKWVEQEFVNSKISINTDALGLLIDSVGDNSWQMTNEISKLSNYKKSGTIDKKDVELMVRPNIENDIFKTIDALVSKDKKLALSLMHKHLDDGEVPLYLLSMITYQIRNLLVIRELQDLRTPYALMAKKSGLHPFVVQKSSYMCGQFPIDKLKKIYHKIFQVDLDIKTGKIEAETALDLLLSEI